MEDDGSMVSIYTDQIRRLYKMAKKFKGSTDQGISQVGDKDYAKKFNRSKDG